MESLKCMLVSRGGWDVKDRRVIMGSIPFCLLRNPSGEHSDDASGSLQMNRSNKWGSAYTDHLTSLPQAHRLDRQRKQSACTEQGFLS